MDSRFAEGVALGSACALQARGGDVPAALSQFAEVIDHWACGRQHRTSSRRCEPRGAPPARRRAGEAAELLGSLERDDSTYGEEAERLGRCGKRASRKPWVMPVFDGSDPEAGRPRDIVAAATWALAVLGDLRARQRP